MLKNKSKIGKNRRAERKCNVGEMGRWFELNSAKKEIILWNKNDSNEIHQSKLRP